MAGHAPGPQHTDKHLTLVVSGVSVRLRCDAEWHTVKADMDITSQVREVWTRVYPVLYRGFGVDRAPAAPCTRPR
mgnify:CR=1 FL=1